MGETLIGIQSGPCWACRYFYRIGPVEGVVSVLLAVALLTVAIEELYV